jgi:uroporphyrinogen-III synthase
MLDRAGAVDTLLITSPATARLFLADPVVDSGLRSAGVEVRAVGPATAEALRRIGWRPSWVGRLGGGEAMVRALAEGRRRRILYPRSSRAGPALSRRLRADGHTVVDPVVYRLRATPVVARAEETALLRADRVLVSSPSALAALRRGLPPRTFDALRRRPGLLVLGSRSGRAARGHGFRQVRTAPTVAGQGFTDFLLRELRRDPN